MARTSRQERRQRRGIAAGTPPLRPPVRPVAVGGDDPAPSPAPSPAPEAESRGGLRIVRFIREAIAELKKVEWPTQHQTVSGTAVVIVACVITGFYLYVNDRVWTYVVQHVLLR